MKAFNNSGKSDEYKPIVDLSNGKYLVNYDKVEILEDEKILKNSRMVGTGKKVPTGNATWKSIIFNSKPTPQLIKNTIDEIINAETKFSIINTFRWKGYSVKLDKENQLNYRNAYEVAKASAGKTLPVTFRFAKAGKPAYYTFDTIDELESFYFGIHKHITSLLQDGWNAKDRVDVNDYK